MNANTQSLHGRVTFKGLVHKVKADVLKEAHKLREPDDDVTPRMYAYVPSDKILVIADIPMALFSPSTRHGIPKAIAAFVQITKANLIAVRWTMYGVYTIDLSPEERAEYDEAAERGVYASRPPAEHPAARESVMATVLDAEVAEAWWCPIKRTADRPPRYGPWYTMDRRMMFAGKMLDPIREALR